MARNVTVVTADASVADLPAIVGQPAADAAIASYTLSVMNDGARAWASILDSVRPGGRVAVVDLALPTGRWALLSPLALLACFTGGVDSRRRPWRWVERDTTDCEYRTLRVGHIRVAAGTVIGGYSGKDATG